MSISSMIRRSAVSVVFWLYCRRTAGCVERSARVRISPAGRSPSRPRSRGGASSRTRGTASPPCARTGRPLPRELAVAHRAPSDEPTPILKVVTGWIARHRRRPGARPCQRAATVHAQVLLVLLVLRWLRYHRLTNARAQHPRHAHRAPEGPGSETLASAPLRCKEPTYGDCEWATKRTRLNDG